MKTLILVRHAAARSPEIISDDAARPLSASGVVQSNQIPELFEARNLLPTKVVTSPAIRALATAQAIIHGLGLTPDVLETCQELYLEGTYGVFSAIAKILPETNCACFVGHNPDLTNVIRTITGARIDELSTGGIAIIGFSSSIWSFSKTGPDPSVVQFEILPEISLKS